jgi:hypothetical protein
MSSKIRNGIMKKNPFLVLLSVFLLAGCGRGAEPTQEATQTPAPPPLEITYCDINPSDMCLVGFDTDIDDRMLVLFRADDRFFADIYMRAKGPDNEIVFECQESENILENVYCLGDPYPEGELIKLDVYSKNGDKLVAIGVFPVHYSVLPSPDVVFEANATPTPSPEEAATLAPTSESSYPNPSYPNQSYPNPTPEP